jgi:hypothetical protein
MTLAPGVADEGTSICFFEDLVCFLEDRAPKEEVVFLTLGSTQGQGFGSALCFGSYSAV